MSLLVHSKFLPPANIYFFLAQQLCFIQVTVGDHSTSDLKFLLVILIAKKFVILVKLLFESAL